MHSAIRRLLVAMQPSFAEINGVSWGSGVDTAQTAQCIIYIHCKLSQGHAFRKCMQDSIAEATVHTTRHCRDACTTVSLRQQCTQQDIAVILVRQYRWGNSVHTIALLWCKYHQFCFSWKYFYTSIRWLVKLNLCWLNIAVSAAMQYPGTAPQSKVFILQHKIREGEIIESSDSSHQIRN